MVTEYKKAFCIDVVFRITENSISELKKSYVEVVSVSDEPSLVSDWRIANGLPCVHIKGIVSALNEAMLIARLKEEILKIEDDFRVGVLKAKRVIYEL